MPPCAGSSACNPYAGGSRMTDIKRITVGLLLWTSLISALHLRLNFDWSVLLNDGLPEDRRKLNVAYIPVT